MSFICFLGHPDGLFSTGTSHPSAHGVNTSVRLTKIQQVCDQKFAVPLRRFFVTLSLRKNLTFQVKYSLGYT